MEIQCGSVSANRKSSSLKQQSTVTLSYMPLIPWICQLLSRSLQSWRILCQARTCPSSHLLVPQLWWVLSILLTLTVLVLISNSCHTTIQGHHLIPMTDYGYSREPFHRMTLTCAAVSCQVPSLAKATSKLAKGLACKEMEPNQQTAVSG